MNSFELSELKLLYEGSPRTFIDYTSHLEFKHVLLLSRYTLSLVKNPES